MDNKTTKKSGMVLYSAKHTLNKLLYWMKSDDGEKTYITKAQYHCILKSHQNSIINKALGEEERKLTEGDRLAMPCKARKLKIDSAGYATRVKLEEKTLTYEELEAGSDLRGIILKNADLSNLDLSRCELEGANLTGCDLSGSTLPQNLKDVNFTNCKFNKNTIFRNNDFSASNIGDCVSDPVNGFYNPNNNFDNADFNGAKIVNPKNLYDQYIIKDHVINDLKFTDSTEIQSLQIEKA